MEGMQTGVIQCNCFRPFYFVIFVFWEFHQHKLVMKTELCWGYKRISTLLDDGFPQVWLNSLTENIIASTTSCNWQQTLIRKNQHGQGTDTIDGKYCWQSRPKQEAWKVMTERALMHSHERAAGTSEWLFNIEIIAKNTCMMLVIV